MSEWVLDPGVVHLNHGSFGACPRDVLAEQQRWRDRLESNPVGFFQDVYERALDGARVRLADFVGAQPADVVFVANATVGVNTVLRSLEPELGSGDEILVTDHAYNACRNAVDATAARTGATVVEAAIPFPVTDPGRVVAAVLDRAGTRTRLALLDHVTSTTALVLPIERLVAELEPQVQVLVDGAHAPGMIPLDIEDVGASFYTGNCHKWICAPKSAGFLSVRGDLHDRIQPLAISHGWNRRAPDRSFFHALFDWAGTEDPSARLSVPAAIDTMALLHPEGWPGVRDANHDLVLRGRGIVAARLGAGPAVPEEMIGSMAALELPGPTAAPAPNGTDPLTGRLADRGFVVPVYCAPGTDRRVLRISAQRYNREDEYVRLAETVASEVG